VGSRDGGCGYGIGGSAWAERLSVGSRDGDCDYGIGGLAWPGWPLRLPGRVGALRPKAAATLPHSKAPPSVTDRMWTMSRIRPIGPIWPIGVTEATGP